MASWLGLNAQIRIFLNYKVIVFFFLFLKITAADKTQVSPQSSDSKLTQAGDFLDCDKRVLPELGLE